jgi:predicted nucleotidyltransferase
LPTLSSTRPELAPLEEALAHLMSKRGDELEFVVLFGSMTRGNWSRGSDYDLLLGLRHEDGKRLIERIGEFADALAANADVFPYSAGEWQRMFADRHVLLLEALEHGLVLHDRGGFAAMREVFREWRRRGEVVPWRNGWKIADPAGGSASTVHSLH